MIDLMKTWPTLGVVLATGAPHFYSWALAVLAAVLAVVYAMYYYFQHRGE